PQRTPRGELAANPPSDLASQATAANAALPPLSAFPGSATPRPSIPEYSILGELGRGGMGVVYKALDLRLGRLVALKMILSGLYAGPQELARMRKEAEALARLRHPNVVQIYHIGEHDGRPFLALEFCDGGSLADHVCRTPQPARAAAQLLESLARAVQAA